MELKRNKLLIRMTFICLLIVPYGIETHLNSALVLSSLLLIVPYGIETRNRFGVYFARSRSFNRTLWN